MKLLRHAYAYGCVRTNQINTVISRSRSTNAHKYYRNMYTCLKHTRAASTITDVRYRVS